MRAASLAEGGGKTIASRRAVSAARYRPRGIGPPATGDCTEPGRAGLDIGRRDALDRDGTRSTTDRMTFSISLPWRRRADAAASPVPGSSASDVPGAADQERRGVVRTLEELDAKIAECDRAGSDNALRQCFGTLRMELPDDRPD